MCNCVMDVVLRRVLYVLLFQTTGCQLRLSITPNQINVEDYTPVTIRCTLNLKHPQTDRVYSILLKRREATVAVYYGDKVDMPGRQYSADGLLRTPGDTAYLEVNLKNVTCVERGDYSCSMAVRQNFRNVKLGPVTSSFRVVGLPSSIQVHLTPHRSLIAVGQAVNITCTALKKTQGSDWSWTVSGLTTQKAEFCSFVETDCLYRCSSSMSFLINKMDTAVQCGFGSMSKRIPLSKSTNLLRETFSTAKTTTYKTKRTTTKVTSVRPSTKTYVSLDAVNNPYPVQYTDEHTETQRVLRNVLIYTFIAVFLLLFLVICWLFLSDRERCRKHHNTEDQLSELHSSQHFQRGNLLRLDRSLANDSQWDQLYLHPEHDRLIISDHLHTPHVAEETQRPNACEHLYEEVG